MVDNNQTLFRKEAMERISSPDDLTSYLRVTSPSVWIILTAVIALLVGLCCISLISARIAVQILSRNAAPKRSIAWIVVP